MEFNPADFLIFEGLLGSLLYGTQTPESDIDKRGVCTYPSLKHMCNPFFTFKVADSFEGEDRSIYELGEFFRLCADNNPNILEMLFVPVDATFYKDERWDKIVQNRHLFLSKNIKHRFLGYAFSQLKAVERHREWFINPPSKKPSREDFGLGQTPIVSEANVQNVLSLPQEIFSSSVRDEIIREREYRLAKKKWDNYMQWQTTRNPYRKGTEERFGYDTKYASHIFRLITEGEQLLIDGEIIFPLKNAKWLLEIKNGIYTYDEIVKMTVNLESRFEMLYAQTSLPKNPDREKLAELYFEITEMSFA